jgi:hypothetical protein
MVTRLLLAHGEAALQVWVVVITVALAFLVVSSFLLARWLVRRRTLSQERGFPLAPLVASCVAAVVINSALAAVWIETAWPKWLGTSSVSLIAGFGGPGLMGGAAVFWCLLRRQARQSQRVRTLGHHDG